MSKTNIFDKIEDLRRTVTTLVFGFFVILLLSYATVVMATASFLGDLLIVVLLVMVAAEVIVFSLALYLLSRPILKLNVVLEKQEADDETKAVWSENQEDKKQ